MTTKPDRDAPADNPLVAGTAGVLAAALSRPPTTAPGRRPCHRPDQAYFGFA